MAILGFVLGGTVLQAPLPAADRRRRRRDRVDDGRDADDHAAHRARSCWCPALLLASVVAALLLTVTLFARSFKEAQTYVAPMSFLLIVPAIALQFRDLIGAGDSVYWIPRLQRDGADGRRREGLARRRARSASPGW